MNNTKLLLAALAFSLVGCPSPTPVMDDANVQRDTSPPRDTNPADVGSDAGVTVDCATYCTRITAACTAANAQYTDMATCMMRCTAAMWMAGSAADTSGNTLGCRIYHAGAPAMADAAMHCPHAGWLGGGVCTPFRTNTPVEGMPTTTAGAYVRVDRMGVPAVATALVGPGLTTASLAATAKDAYNDSNPTEDTQFVSGIPLLTAIGLYHAALDRDLVAANLTPCSVAHAFPVPGAPAPIPACGVQQYDAPPGSPGHTVASLILPDTLRLDMSTASGFPNGRRLQDDVIDPILSALLLNLSPCAGSPTGTTCPGHTTMATCTPDTNCSWTGTACAPLATTRAAQCGALPIANCTAAVGCTPASMTLCIPVPCEFLPSTAACGTQAGCSATRCGTGTPAPACSVATLGGLTLNPHMNDVAFQTTFPYLASAH